MSGARDDEVARLRAAMDAVDEALLALVGQRLVLARGLAVAKGGRPGARDAAREAQVVARLAALGPVPPAAVARIWRALFAVARAAQREG